MTIDVIVAAIQSHAWETLATVLALVAIWQSYRASRFAKFVAEHEGSFDQVDLKIGMFGHEEITRFLILAPITPAPLHFSLPLSIRNLGSATATEIQLLVRGNEALLPYSREWLQKEQPDASGIVVASFTGKDGHVNLITYRIAHLHPGMSLNLINTAILSNPSQFTSELPIKTADGSSVTVTYTVAYEYEFDVVAFQKDGTPLAKAFRLNVLDTTNSTVADVLTSYWKTLENQDKEQASPRSWRRGPKSRLRRICVITVDEAKIVKEGIHNARKATIDSLVGAEGVIHNGGFLVPALGVELGNFQGTLPKEAGRV